MAIEAWFMDESKEDQRLPHKRNPNEPVSLEHLAELGVLYWHLNPKDYENDEELKKIREARGYNYMDLLDLCPEKVANYEEKLKNFYTEHIHSDEEIRYCLEGSGYFDVRNKDDRWVRIWIKAGDLIVLPAGIYHRFTLDTDNYVKLMRLFVGEPVWTAHNRPQEDHPVRKEYIKSLNEKYHMRGDEPRHGRGGWESDRGGYRGSARSGCSFCRGRGYSNERSDNNQRESEFGHNSNQAWNNENKNWSDGKNTNFHKGSSSGNWGNCNVND